MKNLFYFLSLFLSFQLIGQTDSLFLEELRASLDVQNYEEVINRTNDTKTLSESAKYLRGCAYYYTDKEDEALSLFDEIIAVDSTSRGSRYFKSRIHFSREEYDIALQTVNDALGYIEDDPDYFSLKGEILAHQGKFMESIPVIEKALSMNNCSEFNYLLLSDIYNAAGESDKAHEVLEDACTKIGEESYYYEMVFFDTAISHFQRDNPAGAKAVLVKLYQSHPSPKNTEKLIQAHYALGEYKEGNAYKKELYAAKEAGTLPENLENEFCFDQFAIGEDKYVIVAERFDESASLYYKHVFYILDEKNELIETYQTEWSFALEESGKKYVLGYTKESDEGRQHNTYWSYLFDEDFDYDNLKKTVLDVMAGKGKDPSSSSSFRNPNGDLDVVIPMDETEGKSKSKKKKKAKKKKKKKG